MPGTRFFARIRTMQKIKLLSKTPAAASQVFLDFERPEGYGFRAGQFARIGLELPGSEEPLFRAYSIASSPEEKDRLRFLITVVEGGALSPRLALLEPGDEVLLDGNSEGNLLASRIPGGETLWLFGTGSGIAPFLSIIGSPGTWEAWKDVVLVQSVREAKTGAVTKGLQAKDFPGTLTALVTTTRETGTAELSGRIPALIESGGLERFTGRTISPEKARVMLCGNPDFVAATRAVLKARGIVSPRFGRPGTLLAENFF